MAGRVERRLRPDATHASLHIRSTEVSMNRFGKQRGDSRRPVVPVRHGQRAAPGSIGWGQNSNKSLRPDLARSRSAASVPRGALQRPHSTSVVSGARSGFATLIVRLPQPSHTNWNFPGSPIWSASLASIGRSNIRAIQNILPPLVDFHDGGSHRGDEH